MILLKQKNFEKALTFLDASIKDKVTVDFLSKTSNQLDAQLGAYQNTICVTNKGDVFSYYTQFKNMALDFDECCCPWCVKWRKRPTNL